MTFFCFLEDLIFSFSFLLSPVQRHHARFCGACKREKKKEIERRFFFNFGKFTLRLNIFCFLSLSLFLKVIFVHFRSFSHFFLLKSQSTARLLSASSLEKAAPLPAPLPNPPPTPSSTAASRAFATMSACVASGLVNPSAVMSSVRREITAGVRTSGCCGCCCCC